MSQSPYASFAIPRQLTQLCHNVGFRIFLLFLALLPGPIHSAVTLKDAFSSALRRNETIGIQTHRVDQAEEQTSQAKAGFLPSINLITAYSRQDAQETTGVRAPDQYNARLSLSQPLFRGLGDFAGYRAVSLEKSVRAEQKKSATLELYAAVARSFYEVASLESDVQNMEALRGLTEKRIADLRNRARIGRSRGGEVLTAQAQLSLLEAQIENVKTQLKTAREQFSLLTRLEPTSAIKTEVDLSVIPVPLPPLESFLKQIEQRPEIRALGLQTLAFEERIAVAKAGHLPSLDLTGNYYLLRTGLLENVRWDLGVSLTLPLFQGGAIQSQVREAALRKNEQELQLSLSRKNAETEIRNAYYNVQNGLTQIRSLEEALKITERNYLEQSRDYGLGLVTNLETLQALNTFQETKRSLDKSRFQLLSHWTQLEASTAKIPEQDS